MKRLDFGYCFDGSDFSQEKCRLAVLVPMIQVDHFFEITFANIRKQSLQNFKVVFVAPNKNKHEILDFFTSNTLRPDVTCELYFLDLGSVAFAANVGINFLDVEYIARWDSDDLCDPQRLELQLNFLDQNPCYALVGSRVMMVNESGEPLAKQNFLFRETDQEIRKTLRYRQALLHSSLLFRRSVLLEVRGYLYGHTSEDHEMFIRIARDKKKKFYNLPTITTYYRRHKNQLSDISHMSKHFYEISAFLIGEFLRTWDVFYLVGAMANWPPIRKGRHFYFRVLRKVG